MSSVPPPPPGNYPAGPPGYAAPPSGYGRPVLVRQRTGWLLLGQILAIIEAVLGMLGGVAIILLGAVGRSAIDNAINNGQLQGVSSNLLNTATGVFIGVGVVVLLFFLGLLIAGIIAGRPSIGARITVSILVVILLLLSLGSLRTNAGITIGHIVFWVIQVPILFGMIAGTRTRPATAP